MHIDGGQVERGDGFHEKVDQVVLRQPIPRGGRKDIGLVGRPLTIRPAHATISPYQVTGNPQPPDHSNLAFERQNPDRLLASLPGKESKRSLIKER
jgi:hypothetical protein